ncbi:DUF3137 domain-containing protein [Plantibacter flavus]|uniref:hypothetical protein n=1 Tax=Plantibacter flavus TaxID=150123 RepID=UPI003F14E5A4
MTVETRWLTAPEGDVAAAMAAQRRAGRPKWVPTRRRVLFHVTFSLLLWYLAIALVPIGVSVDEFHDGRIRGDDVLGLVVVAIITLAWLSGAYAVLRWSNRPPSPRARIAEWRQTLTAQANGFEPDPKHAPTFSSLMTICGAISNAFVTTRPREFRVSPRFVAPGVEFGNLVDRSRRSGDWHYLAVTLPAALPHLVLDATKNDGLRSDLPPGVDRSRRISLEGDFDSWFRVYAPDGYGVDARYVLTPDVMSSLISTAAYYNVEIVDDRLICFSSPVADFSAPAPWLAVGAMLDDLVPRIVTKAERYRDERVPGQEAESMLADARAALEQDRPWTRRPSVIDADGRRIGVRARTRTMRAVLGAAGWFVTRTLLYVVPGAFAIAGLMSVVDGRGPTN